MEKQEQKISVRELTKEITVLMKDEIVATYIAEEESLQIRFPNGQNFRIKVEEI